MSPLRVYTFAVAAIVLCSCRGGGALPPTFAPIGETPDATSAGATAGGIVNTKNWNVASGKTVKVTKNLAVFASTSITISGTLVVPRGVQVAFFTPSFTNAGTITTVKNAKYAGPVDDLLSACHVNLQSGSRWEIGAGDAVGFTSSTKQNANSKQPCTLIFTAGPFLDAGATGGSDKKRPNGQNGGSIVIGTTDAVARTQALAKKDGHKTLKAYPPDVVQIDSTLQSASGGNGKDDKTGTATADGYSFAGTNGGHGGTIEITTTKIAGSQPQLTAGTGGNGGQMATAFFSAASEYGTYKLNGTAAHPNGYDITFVQGAGGGGGSIVIKAKSWPKSSVSRPGNGGNPSIFFGMKYGSGYYDGCENCILAGSGFGGLGAAPGSGTSNGGSAEIDLASVGKKGSGDRNDKPIAANGAYAHITAEGGYGGSWTQGYANTGVTGGNGGDFTVVPPKHVAIASLKQFGLSITIGQYGNGDSGFYACPDTPPASGAGYNGGNGGHLYDSGLMEFITILSNGSSSSAPSSSFNGGNGSGGNPPGTGGKGGENDEGEAIGSDGNNGNAC